MPKKLKIFSLKIHKSAIFKKKRKFFLNKGTKYKKNYMEGLNSKNKNKNTKYFFFICNFFSVMLPYFLHPKNVYPLYGIKFKKIMTIGLKTKKLFKVIDCPENAQKTQNF